VLEERETPAPEIVEPLSFAAEKPELRFDEDVLSEIATPTLAEVYVNQGQIQEALNIYERVIAQDPDDEASVKRVQELRTMLLAEPPPPEEPVVPRENRKKQKTIALLESWLANIRKMSEDGVSA